MLQFPFRKLLILVVDGTGSFVFMNVIPNELAFGELPMRYATIVIVYFSTKVQEYLN